MLDKEHNEVCTFLDQLGMSTVFKDIFDEFVLLQKLKVF